MSQDMKLIMENWNNFVDESRSSRRRQHKKNKNKDAQRNRIDKLRVSNPDEFHSVPVSATKSDLSPEQRKIYDDDKLRSKVHQKERDLEITVGDGIEELNISDRKKEWLKKLFLAFGMNPNEVNISSVTAIYERFSEQIENFAYSAPWIAGAFEALAQSGMFQQEE